MPTTYNLNEDCVISGTIVSSEVTQSKLMSDDIGRQPVYSVEIKPEPGVTDSLALMYAVCPGPHQLNADEIHRQMSSSSTLVFETLKKPYVSGVNETSGEFDVGTKVKVSARLECKETFSKTQDGFHGTPRLILRFVDLDEAAIPVEPKEIDWDAVKVYYDF